MRTAFFGSRVAHVSTGVKVSAPFMEAVPTWQSIFLVAACLLVAYQAWRGWRRGVVRQMACMVAIASAYVAAIFGGRLLVPWLRPLALPDPLLAALGGALCGLVAFAAVMLASTLLFKKTSQQPIAIVRLGYGTLGALIGGLFGVFLVWIAVLSIRVLGTLAEADVAISSAHRRTTERRLKVDARSRPSAKGVRQIAEMKRSLEEGTTGAVVEQVDPIPDRLYAMLGKLGQMFSDEQSMERFMSHPGVRPLAQHPKIVALQEDPVIARDVLSRNYFGLIRNQRIVEAANDPGIGELMRHVEFEKALDYAVASRENDPLHREHSPD